MINLNLDNISKNKKRKIHLYNKKVKHIHNKFIHKKLEGFEFTDWFNWPIHYYKDEVENILKKVQDLKTKNVKKLIVIGVGGSYLSAKSGIDFLKGSIETSDDIYFIGTEMSSFTIKQVENKIKNSEWAICVISKSGTTLEPSIAFRHFRTLIEKKYKNKANEYIVSITDSEKGDLHKLSIKKGYTKYIIPDGIGGRFSGLTAAGLFPMAFIGIDIKKVLLGASKSREEYLNSNLKTNDAYKYAVLRNILNKKRCSFYPKFYPNLHKKKTHEIFVGYFSDIEMTLEWLKQLFGESEGKNGKGIFPTSALYTRDLHSLGQIIQEGYKSFFETTIWIKNNKEDIKINKLVEDDDNLNYVTDKSLNEINELAFHGIVDAHYKKGKNPNIVINLENRSEESLGYLWFFFFMSVMMSAYLLGVNPFNQPGVEIYKKEMFKNLKKPI